jgi:hypothetical protein
VGILVTDDPSPEVSVGMAVGEWAGVHPLLWTIAPPVVHLRTPEPRAAAADTDRLLEDLRAAVDEAAQAKAPSLVVCRYCGALVAPEHSLGDELCMACGTAVFGVVY